MNNCLLIIDPQVDFCSPNGKLYVENAYVDMINLSQWIIQSAKNMNINKIFITLDMHHKHSIFHPSWWVDADGNPPPPFTNISYNDIKNGNWNFNRNLYKDRDELWINSMQHDSEQHLIYLEKKGLSHTIWPEHCLIGTEGANIISPLFSIIEKYCLENNVDYEIIVKGLDKGDEHYGAFESEVDGSFNIDLLKQLLNFDNIYIAGEALSHCVIRTIEQLYEQNYDERGFNLFVLEDCTSNIKGFEEITKSRFEKLIYNKDRKIKFINSKLKYD